MPESESYSTRHTHPATYYRDTLKIVIAGLKSKARQQTVVDQLNAAKLCAPRGGLWNPSRLRQCLMKIRSPEQFRSRFYVAALELVLAGEIADADAVLLLTNPRTLA